jgi:hypothetical protein
VEGLTPAARRTLWLGALGLAITALLFTFGCATTFVFQQGEPFQASTGQWIGCGVIVVILVAVALLLARMHRDALAAAPAPPAAARVGGVTFGLSSLFMALAILLDVLPVAFNVAGMLFLFALGSWLLWQWSKQPGWSEQHWVAAAGGLLLTYGWYGFVQAPSASGASPLIDTIGNAIFAIGALSLLVFAWRRARTAETANVSDRAD